MSCLDSIDVGLAIAEPNIVFLWNATKSEILSLSNEFQKLDDDDYCTLKVKLESMAFICCYIRF